MVPYIKKLPALETVNAKILNLVGLEIQIHVWQFFGKKVVFTNGCFDIIHQGHIDYLAKASDLGAILIVGVNSDASIKRLGKSTSRPLQDEKTRALVLASMHFITNVFIFDEDTPLELIKIINPSVLVKGADYDENETNTASKKYIVGSDVVRAKGGEVKTLEFLEGFATSAIENKILNNK